MGNSGLECDCDFDQWLGKLITSVGQCVRRTLIACQSVIQCCNWQLDEAGVPSDTVARWDRQRRKGQRDHKMGWGNRSDNGFKKKANSFPFVGTDVYGSGDGKRKILHRLYLPKERKQWEEWEDAVGCPGCVITVEYVKYTLKPVTLWLIRKWSRVWSFVVIQTQAEFHFHYAPIQCTNRYQPWIWSEIDGAIGHYTTWLQCSFYVDVLIKSSIAASCETHSVMEEHQLSLSTTAFFVSERICCLYLSIMKVNEEFGGSGWSTGQKKQFEDKINHSLYAFRYFVEVSSTLVFPYSNRGPPRHCDFVDLIKSETFVKIISRLINDENNP